MAFFIGMVFVLIAHFIGVRLRQLLSRTWVSTFWRAVVLVLMPILGLFMIYILFTIRCEVTGFITSGVQTNLNIPGDATPTLSVGNGVRISTLSILEKPKRTYLNIFGTGVSSGGTKFARLGFLIINTFVLIIDVVLSFVRHDPNEQMETATIANLPARRHLNRCPRSFILFEKENKLASWNFYWNTLPPSPRIHPRPLLLGPDRLGRHCH